MSILRKHYEPQSFYRTQHQNLSQEKGLTIQELADRLHKSKATVSKYERGEITLDVLTLQELAQILSVDLAQLL
ncbi:helix-turn-helix domain-containing protein, partial [Streptococcus oralis]|uniref:helix-turn-helix domain-containing protein n=1 Tax=Streptococcus oralis TaxID=1303 RepID=UPI001F50E246